MFEDFIRRDAIPKRTMPEPPGPNQDEAADAFFSAGETLQQVDAVALQRKWWWPRRSQPCARHPWTSFVMRMRALPALTWDPVPTDRTALAVLRELRPRVAYSCQQGFCKTCKVRVLAGTPEHRDTRLTDTERGRGDMLICVSRAEERLVIDL
ncbi:2Fe-2S iron-sulfur cluster binding domain-containing protein [Mycobacteroides abscessus subsp. bolletii]|nr:2Fe-2S iron-sulfur cluster binding domain-containing protein [Mycobacteroides abscessus subsp. bolletii]